MPPVIPHAAQHSSWRPADADLVGFVRDVLQHLPMEFMAETHKLIGISLEGSVG